MATETQERGAPGWYPDPEQAQTVRYWDGAAWTEQRAPAQPSTTETVNWSAAVGIAIALAGAVAAIIGVFLAYADSRSFSRIVDNSVIHQTEGKIILGLAVVAVLAVYRNRQGKGWSVSVALVGIAILGLAILMGTNMEELGPANSQAVEALGLHPWELAERASPGVGIYVCGVGGLLVLVGGWLLAGDRKRASGQNR